jgi:hypothetical protein
VVLLLFLPGWLRGWLLPLRLLLSRRRRGLLALLLRYLLASRRERPSLTLLPANPALLLLVRLLLRMPDTLTAEAAVARCT